MGLWDGVGVGERDGLKCLGWLPNPDQKCEGWKVAEEQGGGERESKKC